MNSVSMPAPAPWARTIVQRAFLGKSTSNGVSMIFSSRGIVLPEAVYQPLHDDAVALQLVPDPQHDKGCMVAVLIQNAWGLFVIE